MVLARNHLLSFSVGELSCQLLRVFSDLRSVMPPPTSLLAHKHPFWELHYIIRGRFSYTVEKKLYELGPHQLLIIPPDKEHMLTQIHSTTVCTTLSLHIQPPADRTSSPSRALYNALHAPTPLVLDVRPDSTLNEALVRINTLSQTREQVFSVQESLRAYATLLMAALSESLTDLPVPPSHPPRHTSAPHSFLIDQFFTGSFKNGGAADLARMLGVSTRQLDRILLDLFGMNFREKLNQTKLSYAIDLLSNRSLSIEQVAQLLGYSSSTAFGTFIKKETGQTPSALRRNLWADPHSP